MSSPLYALASSGALVDRLSDELDRELTLATDDGAHEIIAWVEQLHRYVASRDNAEPIDGWADLWLEQPEQVDTGLDDEDCCTYCKTHFSEPHDPTCPRSHEDFADEEEPAAEDAEPSLEDQIQAKLGHISTENLIRRMERAEDFGYDDEAVELSRRLREQGKTWKWSDHFFRPQVIIYDAGESPT